jgi:hypothetical protein
LPGADNPEDVDPEPASEDEDALFDLLGVTSPPTSQPQPATTSFALIDSSSDKEVPRGILNISKADLQAGKKTGGRRKKAITLSDPERSPRQDVHLDSAPLLAHSSGLDHLKDEREVLSEGEGKRRSQRRKGRAKATEFALSANPLTDVSAHTKDSSISALSATRPISSKHSQTPNKSARAAAPMQDDGAFGIAALSRSLPSHGLSSSNGQDAVGKGKKKGKKEGGVQDESAVWEMPEQSGPTAAQALTVSAVHLSLFMTRLRSSGSRSFNHPQAPPIRLDVQTGQHRRLERPMDLIASHEAATTQSTFPTLNLLRPRHNLVLPTGTCLPVQIMSDNSPWTIFLYRRLITLSLSTPE